MDILEKIVIAKKQELLYRKERFSFAQLESRPLFHAPRISARDSILDATKTGVIAEFKRKSPSKGVLNDSISVEDVVKGYESSGASVVSVLTDESFFGGSDDELQRARQCISLPILRKDFIIDEYQIIEARSIGADLILLIAAILEPPRLQHLARFAQSLGLQVLMEVHSKEELVANLHPEIDLFGINNRNLKNFHVDLATSYQLVSEIPSDAIKISESGLSNVDDLVALNESGFHGFLIGERFMTSASPANEAEKFLVEYKSKRVQ